MAELFDRYHENYGQVVDGSISFSGLKHDFFMQAKADLIARKLATLSGDGGLKSRALDIGCGVGKLIPYIRPLFASVSGCDVSAESIAQAKQCDRTADFRHYEAGKSLPFENASFDFASAVCVVHHVPPSQWQAFFAEMRRVLKPGGLACVIEHNPLNPATRLAVLRCPFDEDAVLLRSSQTRNLFEMAQFKFSDTEYFLLLPSARPFARRTEYAVRSLPLGAQYASFAFA
jgi:SAM-dependent methyltransferase